MNSQNFPNKENCFYLGYISKIIAKTKQLVIVLDVDFPKDYQNLDFFLLQLTIENSQLIPFKIINNSMDFKNHLRCNIKGNVHDITSLKGKHIYLPLSFLPKFKKNNQFYFHEVIGYQVSDINYGKLGRVIDILDLQQPILIALKQEKEIMIPIVNQLVIKIDKSKKIITTHVPEGLPEMYLN